MADLDLIWNEINTLGGTCASNDFDRGYIAAIGDALAVIERHGRNDTGGMDMREPMKECA